MKPREPLVVRLHARAVRLLLPAELVASHGEEMTRTFAALYQRAARDGRRLRLLARETLGLLTTAWAEREFKIHRTSTRMLETRRRHPIPSSKEAPVIRLESWVHDVRFAIGALLKSGGYTLVATLTLALGIGANTAIFGLVNAVMLKSLPVSEPHELYVLEDGSWTNPVWEAIRDASHGFDGMLAWGTTRLNLAEGGETHYVRGVLTSGSYFGVLGVSPHAGRVYREADDRRGCGDDGLVAVVSYGFWQSYFGGDHDAIGRDLRLDGQPFTIVGVAPPSFHGARVGESFDVAMPLCSEAALRGEASSLDRRSYWWLTILGRVAPGSTLEQAQASLRSSQAAIRQATLPTHWTEADQARYLDTPFSFAPAQGGVSRVRERYRQALLVLLGVSGLVLLVACANIANLGLARGAARRKELAVRVSVGASAGRLIRQLLFESVLLGLSGAVAGALLAHWTSRMLVAQLSTMRTPAFVDMTVDWRMLAFTSASGLVTGLLFGVYPAFAAARRAPGDALGSAARGTTGVGGRFGVGRWLVGLQVGLSTVLLTGAALFLQSYSGLVELDPGFERRNVLIAEIDASRTSEGDDERRQLHRDLLERLRAVPGARAAARSVITPVSGSVWNDRIQVDGFTPRSDRDAIAYVNFVSSGYFRTLGTTVLAGRDLSERDSVDSPRVAVVNETLAAKFFAGDALGETFRTQSMDDRNRWEEIEVVGVVRDAKYQNLREDVPPTAYMPFEQSGRVEARAFYLVRSTAELTGLRDALTAAATEVDPNLALTFRTLDAQVNDSLVQERLLARLSGLFGLVALALAAIGLAGLVAYGVARRRAELGVRLALGSTPRGLVWLVLRELSSVAGAGLVAGSLVALGLGRFVASLLHGLTPSDPRTFAASAAVLSLVALFAALVPARRAARVSATESLRAE